MSVSEKSAQLFQVGIKIFIRLFQSMFESVVFIVWAINHSDVVGMEIFEDSMDSCKLNLLISISAQKFWLSGFEAKINWNSLTLADNSITVNQVRESYGRVLFNEFGFIFVKPFGSALWSLVSNLSVGNWKILKELSDSFR